MPAVFIGDFPYRRGRSHDPAGTYPRHAFERPATRFAGVRNEIPVTGKVSRREARRFVVSRPEICVRAGLMRIAVLADTHNRHPAKLPRLLTGADEIWHLGDVCEPEALVEIERIGPPLRVVLGNNDFYPGWPLVLRLEREGVRFHLEHIPPRRAPADCDVVLHGHTHVPRDETAHGLRWLNPGCVSYANRGAPPSFAWLTLEKNRPLQWRLVAL